MNNSFMLMNNVFQFMRKSFAFMSVFLLTRGSFVLISSSFMFRSQLDGQLTGTGVVEAVKKDLTSLTEEFQTYVLPFVVKHSSVFP